MMLRFAHSAFSFHFLQPRVFSLHYEKFYSCNQKVSILFEINSIVYSGKVAWQASGTKFLRIFNWISRMLRCRLLYFVSGHEPSIESQSTQSTRPKGVISFATFAGRQLLRETAIDNCLQFLACVQSNNFPHIPGKITWYLNTIINGKSQTLLPRFFWGERAAVHRLAVPSQCHLIKI